MYTGHSASPSAVSISGTAVKRGFVERPENLLEFGRYFVLSKFPFWRLEINLNNIVILRSINYLSRNAEGDKRNSCKNLFSSEMNSVQVCYQVLQYLPFGSRYIERGHTWQ